MRLITIFIIVFLSSSLVKANISVVYEVDQGNLHIRYEDGGFKNRSYSIDALVGLLRNAEQKGYIKVPVFISEFYFGDYNDNIVYKIGYGSLNYAKLFDTPSDTVTHNGITLYISRQEIDIETVLKVLFYAIQNVPEIRSNSVTQILNYNRQNIPVEAVSASFFSKMLAASSTVPSDLWNRSVNINLSSAFEPLLLPESNIFCEYRNKDFNFYKYPYNEKTHDLDTSKKENLLRSKKVLSVDIFDTKDYLVRVADHQFYFVNYNTDAAFGPFTIKNVSRRLYDTRLISHTFDPYDIVELKAWGDSGANKILIVPEKNLVIERYDTIQKHLIDSLATLKMRGATSTRTSNASLVLFFVCVVSFIGTYMIKAKII